MTRAADHLDLAGAELRRGIAAEDLAVVASRLSHVIGALQRAADLHGRGVPSDVLDGMAALRRRSVDLGLPGQPTEPTSDR
jgi:hypothetical protein